jgi:hypothetical protein
MEQQKIIPLPLGNVIVDEADYEYVLGLNINNTRTQCVPTIWQRCYLSQHVYDAYRQCWDEKINCH